MSAKQTFPLSNGTPDNHPALETNASATHTAPIRREHLKIQNEHHEWLNRARKGQVKNRRMLALLTRIESMILDRDAKIASLMARVEAHDAQVRWHDEASNSGDMVYQAHLNAIHIRYNTEHAAVREIFSHFEEDEEQFNAQVEDVVQALLRSL